MPDASLGGTLVLAYEGRQELALTDPSGTVRRRVPTSGYPLFPTARPGGGLAYLAITTAPDPWQVVVTVLDSEFKLLDMIPGAAVFAGPVWSSDGRRLLFVRGDSAEAHVVEWSYEDSEEISHDVRPALRSAAWGAGGELVYSIGGAVRRGAEPHPLAVLPAASGLIAYGSDDLYATIDQLSVAPSGAIAAVERWYRQGREPKERIIVIASDGHLERREPGRAPQWLPDGGLLYTTESGAVQLPAGDPIFATDASVHSACWTSLIV